MEDNKMADMLKRMTACVEGWQKSVDISAAKAKALKVELLHYL